jgi:hypothetical protein
MFGVLHPNLRIMYAAIVTVIILIAILSHLIIRGDDSWEVEYIFGFAFGREYCRKCECQPVNPPDAKPVLAAVFFFDFQHFKK